MIKISKSGFLTLNRVKYKCSFGKNGFTKNKLEGDLKTPVGIFKFLNCYYRSDRTLKPLTYVPCIKIKKDMGWCDDPLSEDYNKPITLPSKFSHEKLYRKDNMYDIFLVINYNINPTKKFLGSAIFLHIANYNYKPTKGCVSISKKNLIYLLKNINTDTKIKIG